MSATTTIIGRVGRIRFQKGYFLIAEVMTGHTTSITVKGQMPGVYEGDMVSLAVRLETGGKYGDTYVVEACTRDERSGIETVLELLPEVGPQRAHAIRTLVGAENVFDVIEREPHRLRAIPGLTDDRIAAIRTMLLERKAERDLLVWCGDNGVSSYHAGLIWKTFKGASLAVLKERPYDLTKVAGFGFLTADRVARRAGADAMGKPRARAAILYVIAEAESADGSTVVEADMILAALKGHDRGPGGRRTACQLSPPLEETVIYAALAELRSEREIYMGGTSPVLIQRGVTRGMEKLTAEMVAEFVLAPSSPAPQAPEWRRSAWRPPEPDDEMQTKGMPF